MFNFFLIRVAGRVESESPWVGSSQDLLSDPRVGSDQLFSGSGRVGSEKSDPRPTLDCHAYQDYILFKVPKVSFIIQFPIINYQLLIGLICISTKIYLANDKSGTSLCTLKLIPNQIILLYAS